MYILLRLARFTFLGGCLVGPTLHYWYSFLSRSIVGKGITASIFRLAADQLVFSPIFMSIFISSVQILQGCPELVLKSLNLLHLKNFSIIVANLIYSKSDLLKAAS
jgi:hypothetical protein